MKTDSELLQAIAKRDQHAFRIFYEKYSRLMSKWAFTRLKDYDESSDLLQEFWAYIWENPLLIKTENEEESAEKYLLRLLSYRLLDSLKKPVSIEFVGEELIADNENSFLQSYSHVLEEYQLKELVEIINGILSHLPVPGSTVFRLSEEGFSIKEIARKVNLSEYTVRYHLSDTKKKVYKQLEIIYLQNP